MGKLSFLCIGETIVTCMYYHMVKQSNILTTTSRRALSLGLQIFVFWYTPQCNQSFQAVHIHSIAMTLLLVCRSQQRSANRHPLCGGSMCKTSHSQLWGPLFHQRSFCWHLKISGAQYTPLWDRALNALFLLRLVENFLNQKTGKCLIVEKGTRFH